MKMIDRISNKFWRNFFIPFVGININNRQYKVPRFILNNFYKAGFSSETWLCKFLVEIDKLKRLNYVIDVGVNIGQTFLKFKSINPDINYIGFEPNPNCCSLVNQLIQINQLSHSKIIPSGLSDKNQLLQLAFSKNQLLAVQPLLQKVLGLMRIKYSSLFLSMH